ncbi:bifunctional Tetratricopeptide-like helical domain superfamily/Tetratricopeptide repeat/Transcription factor Tfc4-TFIIIC-102-Sfc4 [Babesia duncani]|uniref:Bifunctional Tetratricopeptide-like helical domain superfamily/Tetratricopeptide repeat/Transcription factor Tfc4-TFIIIC-102-Sfc4 n=1 Tax=Babesia duncani TaxID=323732 RepID=A0AAD9PNZ8_9APIC|nr:bifunctional Tetratricopeptide-like helical domain superfamily/Tetratricopeptide repeat/Transcription factor Tfc4-TFIIIC-102-Sfc4 [Babesia duncani]
MGDVLAAQQPKSKRASNIDKMLKRLMRRRAKRKNTTEVEIKPKKKKQKRRKTAAQSSKLTPEQELMIGKANELFIQDKLDEAEVVLKELIRVAPGIHEPFHTLGLIKEARGKIDETIGCYLVAALFVQTDVDLWRRIGEMSQENGYIDLAIYCFKKTLKTEGGGINEDVHFSLAICFLERGDHLNAIKYLTVLFELHPQDALLATELTKSLQIVGDSETCLSVYEKYFSKTSDLNVVEPICKLQIELFQNQKCLDFVGGICKILNCNTAELEPNIMVLYSVACIRLDVPADDILQKVWDLELEDPDGYHHIAMALAEKSPDSGLEWFKRNFNVHNVSVALKMAESLVQIEGNTDGAIKVLTNMLNHEPNNTQVLIMLSDVLIASGKHADAEELMARLSLMDFDRISSIQIPIALEHRELLLNRLYDDVDALIHMTLKDLTYRKYPCLLANNIDYVPMDQKVNNKLHEWIERFLHVIRDCELDTRRTIQSLNNFKILRSTETISRIQPSNHSIMAQSVQKPQPIPKAFSFLRTKQELGLKSAEDVMGWSKYEELLHSAAIIFTMAGRPYELITLFEQIVNNKKRYRSNVDVMQRKSLVSLLEHLIFQVSTFRQMCKVAMTYARNSDLHSYARLLASGKLARAALLPLSASVERDVLLENRSWITRQLLQQPHNSQMQMLAGHFCTLSGNWTFAIGEYKRAHMSLPHDPLVALCLATSFLNSASSKLKKDGGNAILLGATFLQRYTKLRLENCPRNCEKILLAETIFNMARCLHFINKIHLAVEHYQECLNVLKDIPEARDVSKVECPCVYCEYSRSKGLAIPHSAPDLGTFAFLSNHGVTRIKRSAAFNLHLIYMNNNNTPQAHSIATKYIIWS